MAMYNRGEKSPESPGAAHLALMLILDVSASMNYGGGNITPIQSLNDGVNQMIEVLSKDGTLSKIIDLAIITFADPNNATVFQDFAPIGSVTPIHLVADGGSTYAVDAIDLAVDKIRARTRLYTGGAWKPWIVLITDGELHDDVSQVAKRVRERENDGKLRMLCLGVGEQFNPHQLQQLTDKVFQLNGYDFRDFFEFLGKSVAVISRSSTASSAGYGITDGDPVENMPDPRQVLLNPFA